MCIWWNNICNNSNNNEKQFDLNEPQRQNNTDYHSRYKTDLYDRQISTNYAQCVIKTPKSYHIRSIDNTFWLHYMYSIFIIWSLNVFVVAIAYDSLSILNSSQQQPCDRSRRVFTDIQGEISDGPTGFNYTQVSLFFSIFFLNVYRNLLCCGVMNEFRLIGKISAVGMQNIQIKIFNVTIKSNSKIVLDIHFVFMFC